MAARKFQAAPARMQDQSVCIEGGFSPSVCQNEADEIHDVKEKRLDTTGPVLNVILIYAKDTQQTAAFYQRYFGFASTGAVSEGLIELIAPPGGANILIYQAGKGVKMGQAGVKLTFSVQDVEGFKAASAALGLEFGSTHQASGYTFANAKDPDGNSVSISSRAFRSRKEDSVL